MKRELTSGYFMNKEFTSRNPMKKELMKPVRCCQLERQKTINLTTKTQQSHNMSTSDLLFIVLL